MKELHVIGISGSPRLKGNTSLLVQKCLEGTKSSGATTEFFSLANKVVNPCRGCENICHPNIFDETDYDKIINSSPWDLCPQNDDSKMLIKKMVKADSIIIGSPVYFANINSQIKALFDRCTCIGQFSSEGKLVSPLKYKVGGSVVVGGSRNGGQSFALQTIVTFFLFFGVIPVGFSEQEDQALGLSGVAYSPHEITKDTWINFMGKQQSVVEHALDYGKKIADISLVIKAGISSRDDTSFSE